MNQVYILLLGLGLMLSLPVSAQNQPRPIRPLSEYDKQLIMDRISLSADWDRINELKQIMSLMPAAAPYYQSQIDAILEQNRHNLNGAVVMQEETQWQQYLQNLEHVKKFGYDAQPTEKSIADGQERQRTGKPPLQSRVEKMQQHMVESLKEAEQRSTNIKETDYYNSPQYLDDVPRYVDAKTFIKEMLEGKRALFVKDAYYMAEASYGNLHLTYDEYNTLIKANADFIRQWLKENKYDLNNTEMLHFGIQKFMSDTLYIHLNGKKTGHMPYYYDYIDPRAKEDKRNYFVTKTLATGTGQCHTFPVTYLILAEALGVQAYLAYNPQHSFIRYKNNKGAIINYETTVDRFLADAFYLQTLPVMAKAQKNKLYGHSLNKKQVVASVLYDLAANFIREHWTGDRKFIKECMSIAKPYFPDQSYISNTESYLHQRFYADDINAMVKAKGIKDGDELEKHADIVKAYRDYYSYMDRVSALGVQEFPEEDELRMLEYADKKGRLQVAKGINAKEKRSLFIN
jgi:hypothetical protein